MSLTQSPPSAVIEDERYSMLLYPSHIQAEDSPVESTPSPSPLALTSQLDLSTLTTHLNSTLKDPKTRHPIHLLPVSPPPTPAAGPASATQYLQGNDLDAGETLLPPPTTQTPQSNSDSDLDSDSDDDGGGYNTAEDDIHPIPTILPPPTTLSTIAESPDVIYNSPCPDLSQMDNFIRTLSPASTHVQLDEDENDVGPKLIVFMVGLPARGKSYLCQKFSRYLTWLGFETKVFNVGNRRRVATAAPHHSNPNSPDLQSPTNSTTDVSTTESLAKTDGDSTFFDPTNKSFATLRDTLALQTLDDIFVWLKNGGKVAVHDATNSTLSRRRMLLDRVAQEPPGQIEVMFLESICTDEKVLEQNLKMKLFSPDYKDVPRHVALKDFRKRMENYEKAYDPLGETEEREGVPYISLINVGRKIISHQIFGYLPSQIMFYLTNVHIESRTIWLTRHGESEFNPIHKIGGDPQLTAKGRGYALALKRFFDEKIWEKKRENGLIRKNTKNLTPQITSLSLNAPRDLKFNTRGLSLNGSISNTRHPSIPPVGETELLQPRPIHRLTSRSRSQSSTRSNLSEQLASSRGVSRHSSPYEAFKPSSSSLANSFGALQVGPVRSASASSSLDGRLAGQPPRIMTSATRRGIDTVAYFDAEESEIQHMKVLNELFAGDCECMTYEEIDRAYPGTKSKRAENKLFYRYPGLGSESYLDVIERLKPLIIETERLTVDLMIVTHNVVSRTLLGYYMGVPLPEMVTMEIPLHRLYALSPRPYGTELEAWDWDEVTGWKKVVEKTDDGRIKKVLESKVLEALPETEV